VLQIYQEAFEKKFLEATDSLYRVEGQRLMEERDVSIARIVDINVHQVSPKGYRASAGFFCSSQFFNLSVPDIRGLFFQRAIDIFSVVNSPQSPVFYRIIFCYSL